jgi:TRAP-type uncharacterized transport system substrate-binding protein
VREILKVYGPIVLIVVAVIAVALRFVDPPPPREIRFAAGQPGGYYHTLAGRYGTALARDKITAQVLATQGSVDNLKRLAAGEADVALIQGGIASEENAPKAVALAGLF